MASVLDARGGRPALAQARLSSEAVLRAPATPWLALAGLLIATGALLLHETRGTTIVLDEWTWLLHRRGDALSTYLASHAGHLSLIPVALYKLLFATVGLRHSAPYRAVMVAEHLAICALVFVYARRRVGVVLALVATALMALFGPGWENLLWAFQVTWNTSLLAGLAALLALDRRDRAGEIAACALLLISLASSGIGVPILVGVAVEVALVHGRRWRDWWLIGIPVVLYTLWAVRYQHTIITRHALVAAPSFVATGVASTFAGIAGLGGATGVDGRGTLMTWGPPLLLAVIALAVWRVARVGRLEPRVVSLATIVLAFWAITAVNRSVFADPYSSRYLYVSALFVVLLAVELAQGANPARWLSAVIVALAAAAIASNFGALRDAARNLRANGQRTIADLGAVNIGRPVVPAGYIIHGIPGWPIIVIRASSYFAASRAVPMLAASPAEIRADPEPVREIVDNELIQIHRVALLPPSKGLHTGSPPVVDLASGGTAAARAGCIRFAPDAFAAAGGAGPLLSVTLPPSGVVLRTAGGSATVELRRFASSFQPLGTLAQDSTATLVIGHDLSNQPWHLMLKPAGRAVVCGLS